MTLYNIASTPPRVHLSLLLILGLSVTLSPNLVSAEETASSVDDGQISLSITPADVKINLANCESITAEREFTLSGTYNVPTGNYTTRLFATTGSSCTSVEGCDKDPLEEGGCYCFDSLSNTATLSQTFTVSELFDDVCVEGENRTISFFLNYKEEQADMITSFTPRDDTSPAVKLLIDLEPPPAPPEAPGVIPAEEALVITAPDVGGDVVRYEACVWPAGESREDARCQEVTVDSGSRFEGLINDVSYTVIYVVYDEAGNRSGDSPEGTGSPTSVLDFAEVYSGEYPGGERGGCQSVTLRSHVKTPHLFLLFLLGLLCLKVSVRASAKRLMSHTKMKRSLLVFLSLFTLIDVTQGEAKPTEHGRSSMTSTVTFSGGAYQPRIDDEFLPQEGTQRPYERVFEDQSPVMFQLQVERHLLQDVGLVSIGGVLGYWSVEGDGLSVTNVTETTKMTILPYSVYGAYRLDLFKNVFPVVPTLKVGVSYYSWTIYDGGGDPAFFVDKDGTKSEASGGTMGWFYSIGAQFLLDFLDREMAWAFDRDAGVNHSYLTFEYQSSQVNDFGDPDSFRLGNDTFLFGITLDL